MQEQHLKKYTNHHHLLYPRAQITRTYTAYTNNCKIFAVTYIATNIPNPVMNMK